MDFYLDDTETIIWVVIGVLIAIGYYGMEWYINKPDSKEGNKEE